jgi:hypothetical protein
MIEERMRMMSYPKVTRAIRSGLQAIREQLAK